MISYSQIKDILKMFTRSGAKKHCASKSPESSKIGVLKQVASQNKSNSEIKAKRTNKQETKRQEKEVRSLLSCCLIIAILTLIFLLEEASCINE